MREWDLLDCGVSFGLQGSQINACAPASVKVSQPVAWWGGWVCPATPWLAAPQTSADFSDRDYRTTHRPPSEGSPQPILRA